MNLGLTQSQELISTKPIPRCCFIESGKGGGSKRRASQLPSSSAVYGTEFATSCQKVGEFLVQLWQDQHMCDVIIRCCDGVMKAHKAVLSLYSPFCLENFSKFPNESAINIDLCEFPCEVIKMLMEFVYLRKEYEMTPSNVANMVKAGGELGLTEIVESGIDFLCEVNVNNALYHYAIADHCCLEKTREKIFCYILDNFRDISRTNHFMWLHPEVLLRILSDDHLRVHSELDVFYALVQWIDCDRCKRMPLAPTLLLCGLRLMEIPPEELISKVEKVDWLFESEECGVILNEAIRCHALRLSNSSMTCPGPFEEQGTRQGYHR